MATDHVIGLFTEIQGIEQEMYLLVNKVLFKLTVSVHVHRGYFAALSIIQNCFFTNIFCKIPSDITVYALLNFF